VAQMIPQNAEQLSNPTSGEKSLFRKIERCLPNDWICYALQRMDKDGTPDFLLIAPKLGFLILEEKSLPINLIKEATTERWTVIRDGSPTEETHPLRQARNYVEHAIKQMHRVGRLRGTKGKLKFTYGHGVVLSNITRKQLLQDGLFSASLGNTFDRDLVVCKDELPTPSDDGNDFRERLSKMTAYFSFDELDDDDIQAIRASIYPEIIARKLGGWVQDRNVKLHTMAVEQEQIARGIGKSDQLPHRLVRGVVGSGKTLVLLMRARIIATENPEWSVLVTFFTRSLTGYMRQNMPLNIKVLTLGQVMCRHWTKYQSKESFPDPRTEDGWQEMSKAFSDGRLKKGIYHAILVDEAQDLTAAQADCLRALLNEETNCAFFCGDGAQNIFNKKVVWKNHGFYFKGRSTKKEFLVNYRNTQEIYDFAERFLEGALMNHYNISENEEDGLLTTNSEIKCRRHGPVPRMAKYPSTEEEREGIIKEIVRLITTQHISPNYITILLPYATPKNQDVVEPYLSGLADAGVPVYWLTKDEAYKSSYQPGGNYVVISTPESAKGLEWEIVFAPSMNKYHDEKAATLRYVAATRAREILYPSEVAF